VLRTQRIWACCRSRAGALVLCRPELVRTVRDNSHRSYLKRRPPRSYGRSSDERLHMGRRAARPAERSVVASSSRASSFVARRFATEAPGPSIARTVRKAVSTLVVKLSLRSGQTGNAFWYEVQSEANTKERALRSPSSPYGLGARGPLWGRDRVARYRRLCVACSRFTTPPAGTSGYENHLR